MPISVTHIDTACMLLEIDGLRLLTDPVFDAPGKWYHHGFGAWSKKTGMPALTVEQIGKIDVLLLSHHQHKDNFDATGRKFATKVPLILSTPSAQKAIPGIHGMAPWESFLLQTPNGNAVHITAVPAQHHPSWLPAFFSGPTTGFMIEITGYDPQFVYISGDTVFFPGMHVIHHRFPKIDIAFFHLGSAQFRYLSGWGRFTMHTKDLLRASQLFDQARIVPIHQNGWSHFKENKTYAQQVMQRHPEFAERMVWLNSGEKVEL